MRSDEVHKEQTHPLDKFFVYVIYIYCVTKFRQDKVGKVKLIYL